MTTVANSSAFWTFNLFVKGIQMSVWAGDLSYINKLSATLYYYNLLEFQLFERRN